MDVTQCDHVILRFVPFVTTDHDLTGICVRLFCEETRVTTKLHQFVMCFLGIVARANLGKIVMSSIPTSHVVATST